MYAELQEYRNYRITLTSNQQIYSHIYPKKEPYEKNHMKILSSLLIYWTF